MRKLAIFSFAFGLSVALYIYLSFPGILLWCCVGLLVLSFAALRIFRKHKRACVACLVILGLCFGFLYCSVYERFRLQPAKKLAGSSRVITVEVLEPPVKSTYGYKLTGQLDKNLHRTRVLLYLDAEPDVSLGDQIQVFAEIRDSLKSSGGEDFLYYQTKDISLVCIARDDLEIIKCDSLPLRLYPAKLSLAIKGAAEELFDSRAQGFMQALMTGDRGGLTEQQKSDLSRSGISHVIAISGMHVSILLGAVYFLTGRKKRLTALIGIPIVLVFAAMVGFSPSVTRAAVMQIIFLLAPILKRENDLPTTLGFSLLVNLLINPWAVSSLSLQLSYTSLIGILLFGSKIHQWILPRTKEKPRSVFKKLWHRVYSYVVLCISTTLAATVFTAPLLAFSFGGVSVLSVITNILVLWAISLCFTFGYIAVLLGQFWSFGAQLIAKPINLLVHYILRIAGLISSIPYASVSAKNPFVLGWLLFSYALLLVHLLLRSKRKKGLFAGLITASLLLCVGLTVFQRDPAAAVTAVDVGQGQCLIFRNEDWCAVFDCGGSDGFESAETAAEYLENQGQPHINCLIVSHYDEDHVGGIPQLIHRLKVDQLYLPDVKDDTGWREVIEQTAAENQIPVQYVTSDVSLQLPTGHVCITPPLLSDSDNSACLCLIFRADALSALATADMDIEAENRLMHRYDILGMDILIAGHHGSKYSTSGTLLRSAKPETVLISVGRNSYGHPSEEVLARIEEIGAEVFRTDTEGTITIKR